MQQSFDQASDAVDRGDCAAALPMFERLSKDPHIKPGSLPAATIAVRRGVCLSTRGQDDEARREIESGLPTLRGAGASMAGDVARGEETLGILAMRDRDHDGAISHIKAAMALTDEPSRVRLLIWLAQVSQFDGGSTALGYADEAMRIVNAQPKPRKADLAAIHTVRGRIMLNQGQNKQALAELKQALSLSGGLTNSNVSLAEVSMRGDLAEAALLTGDKAQAHLYLAYTGAGRIEESPFAVAISMAPPQCGPETGLSPEDSAIVEFGIDADGDVPVASTVYTRGDYAVASAFAQAVEKWYWQPEKLAKVPAFYKALTRVELRCSTSDGDTPGTLTPLKDRFGAWATPLLDGIDFQAAKRGSSLERLAALAKQHESEGRIPAAVAALAARGILEPYTEKSTLADFDRALSLADEAHLPSDITDAIAVFREDAARDIARYKHSDERYGGIAGLLSARPALVGDALAYDTLLLLTTPSAPGATQRANATGTLARVADDEHLPLHHPLRQAALIRLANIAASAGKLEDAHAYFVRTGLSEQQCSLIGVTPAMKSSGADSDDYPAEALAMGFAGWVHLEFDINADGTTGRARAITAYPPFVFVDAATGMARNFRYQASYRPSHETACTAKQETVSFQNP